MTIYIDGGAEVEILDSQYSTKHGLELKLKLKTLFPDGSGKIGGLLGDGKWFYAHACYADDGLNEIIEEAKKVNPNLEL